MPVPRRDPEYDGAMRGAWLFVLAVAMGAAIGACILFTRGPVAFEDDGDAAPAETARPPTTAEAAPSARPADARPVVARPFGDPEPAEDRAPIRIRVLDEAGQPVAGVRGLLIRKGSSGGACCVAASP